MHARENKAEHKVWRAALWMMGTLVSFSVMGLAARELSAQMKTFEILFFRSFISLIILLPIILRAGIASIKTHRFGGHFARNVAHFGGQYGWVYALGLMPLAEVFAIEFTLPVWTAIAAILLLGERLTKARSAAIVLGLAGMVVITRPGTGAMGTASIAALLSAMAYGLSHTMTKRLVSTEKPLTILFYMSLIQLPMGLFPALGQWIWPAWSAAPWLLGLGVTALTGHYCMVRAFGLADAMVVVPLDFLRLPCIAVVGAVFYGEKPTWFLFVGALLMLAGNLVGIRSEQARRAREDKNSQPRGEPSSIDPKPSGGQ